MNRTHWMVKKVGGRWKQSLAPISSSDFEEGVLISLPFHETKRKDSDIRELFYMLNLFDQTELSLVDALDFAQKEMGKSWDLSEAIVAIRRGGDVESAFRAIGIDDIFLLSSLQIGHRSGNMGRAFETIHRYISKRIEDKEKLRKILFYPMIILGNLVLVLLFTFFYISPQIIDLYRSMGAQLPGMLMMYESVRSFVSNHGVLLFWLALLPLCVLFFRRGIKPDATSVWQSIYRLPVLGDVLRKQYLASFSWMLRCLLESGHDIVSAFHCILESERNPMIREKLSDVLVQVKAGVGLHSALERHPELFEELYVSYIARGEEAGLLTDNVRYLSEYYESRSKQGMERLQTVGQPLLIIVLGLFILLLMMTIMPLLDVTMLYGGEV